MAFVTFTVYGKPEPSGSKKAYVVKGHAVVTDANEKAKPWQQQVAGTAIDAMGELPIFTGAVEVTMSFYRRRPINHLRASGEVKEGAPDHPITRPDVLKLGRAVEDAMTGIVYRDDEAIVAEHLAKFYGEPERVEVLVREL